MTSSEHSFAPVRRMMENDGLPDLAIRTFRHYFDELASGTTGLLSETDIQPVTKVADLAQLVDSAEETSGVLGQCVMIKLNGGLGTSMGLDQAKSLLPARESFTFLDLIARQILYLRQQLDRPVPLLLMNSFATHSDSIARLESLPELAEGQAPIPLAFLQHRVPRLDMETLAPIQWPQARHREWCPPGHGDIYTALAASGLLEQLLGAGYRYAFVSNADNLGATLEPRILEWMASERIPFLMEVTERTLADRKGGHLAQDHDGRLRLREFAQCPPEEQESFQDIGRYSFFNTNNLWLDLEALAEEMQRRDGILGLPIIRNLKHLVPEDHSTPQVIQVETAMGSALEVFDRAQILRVPRSRFAPVKTTNDLLALWSDRFSLTDNGEIVATVARPLDIDLDPVFYASIAGFRDRFPHGAPSLKDADGLRVRGDIRFGADVVIHGRVNLENPGPAPRMIEDGSVLHDASEGLPPATYS